MSVSKQIIKNIEKNKNGLILLVILLITVLVIHYSIKKNSDTEGFANPEPTIPSKYFNNIFFLKDFPKQDLNKVYETVMGDGRYISFWERKPMNEYFPIGQACITTENPATIADLTKNNVAGLTLLVKGGSFPIDYEKIWDNKTNAEKGPVTVWKPIPPKNHIALGDIVVAGFDKPLTSLIKCLPIGVLEQTKNIKKALWKNPLPRNVDPKKPEVSPPGSMSIWEIGDYNLFFGKDSYQRPDSRSDKIYKISQKILENNEVDPEDAGTMLQIRLTPY
jgi:hypothetical protein